jgi:hypothetical protein
MSNQDDHLNEIERGLYSRTRKIPAGSRRHPLSPDNREEPTGWAQDKSFPALELDPGPLNPLLTNFDMKQPKKKLSRPMIFLFLAIIFFIGALSFVGYSIFFGGNVVSSDNININITGPISIPAGETLSYSLSVQNNNSVDLSSLNYLVEYPDGTRQVGDISKELKREGNVVDVLKAGGSFQRDFKVVLFGTENEAKTIKVTIEYRVPGSNAIFNKVKTFDVSISSAPVSVIVTGLSEITSGQAMTFTTEIRSNSSKVIKDLILQAVFPSGFTLKKSVPDQAGLNTWSIGDLEPGGVRKLTFTGVMEGQDGEERIFKFNVGLKSTTDNLAIGTPFFSSISSVVIQKPFIGISLVVDGDTATEHVAKGGTVIRTDVLYQNNLPEKILDAKISIKLTGNALNRSSVVVENGYFDSINNTIIFSKEYLDTLAALDPSSNGRLGFSFSTYPFTTLLSGSQDITMAVTVSGTREGGVSVPQEILSTAVKKIKISTDLNLSSLISYFNGPFKNTGGMPPKAEKETSYTITWSLSDSFNDVGNITVSANLPSYVRWLNVISNNENVTYNPVGGEVVWSPSDIKSGTGVNSSPKQVSFQVSILPSLSQVDTSPTILTESVVHGIDKFTNTDVTDTKEALTTILNGDTNFDPTKGNVVK